MKNKIILLLALVALVAPVLAWAHMGEIGEGQLEANDYSLMLKMMSGEELSDAEWTQMREFMEEHHQDGGFGMMQMMGAGFAASNSGFGPGMMAGYQNVQGGPDFWDWMLRLNLIGWLLVAILASFWLIRKLSEK